MRSLLLLSLLGCPAQAQVFDAALRYELGQRLRMFEAALDKHKADKNAIKRAIPPVAAATPAFFAGKLGDAAAILDRARLTLDAEKPDQENLWASSWRVTPDRRVGSARAGKVKIRVVRFYKTTLTVPKSVSVDAAMSGERKGIGIGLGRSHGDEELPLTFAVDWEDMSEGDHALQCRISVGSRSAFSSESTFSHINDLQARIKKLEKSDLLGRIVEAATLAHHLDILNKLAKGDPLETDYPAHRLLVEAEAIAAGKWDNKKPGQFWLALPGIAGSPVRILVPKEAAKGKPLPVVVAMHGAGGSENMFFDGYGNGLAARLAAERGWFVVAPRSGFFAGPDVPAILDALAKIQYLDLKKVCVVGHSMGASQAVSAAGRNPVRFAAVAVLGGGGGFKEGDGLKKLPFLVGVGEHDIGRKPGAALAAKLKMAGIDAAFKAYPELEHLTVVQMSLPEVFRFFDKALK